MLKSKINEISAKLSGKQTTDGYVCLCPAHNDRNPSLSITEKDGKILVHCHAGCSQENVIQALKGLNLWLNKETRADYLIPKQNINLGSKVIEYSAAITTETIELLSNDRMISPETTKFFQLGQCLDRVTIPVQDKNGIFTDIRRYKPVSHRKAGEAKIKPQKDGDGSAKLFPQQTITWLQEAQKKISAGEPENVGNLGNLEYQAASKFLVLCEGELDTLALISNGIPAITNTCGAGTWNDEFSKQLSTLNIPIIVLMDNDSAGESGASKRIESLLENNIKVSSATWPLDRPSGHDVIDELKNYGVASLLEIINKAEDQSDIVFLDKVITEKVDWLFEPFIAVSKTSLLEGEPGIGKSFLSLYLASLVSVGGAHPLDEESIVPIGKVLLMSAEDGLGDTIKPRLEKMVSNLSQIFAPKEIFTLDDKGFSRLEKLIEREKPILVIIDPLTPFLDGKKDINHSKDMRPFFKNLAKLAEKYSCAILVTRHLAKSKDFNGVSKGLGSIDIAAAVRSILQVTSDEGSNVKRVSHIKCNIAAKGKPFGYVLENNGFKIIKDLKDIESDEEDQSELERAVDFLKDALGEEPVDANVIKIAAKDAGISSSTLNRAKKKIKIVSKKITGDGKIQLWQWSLPAVTVHQDNQHIQDAQDSHKTSDKTFKHFQETDADRD